MREELRAPHAGLAQFVRLHERHAALVHHQPARGQDARAVGVELVGEQHLAHADRIGGIDDDRVERRVRRALHIIDAVADDHLGARIVPGIAADRRQELLRQPDHLAVDFHHHRAPHAAMLQHAPQHAAIAGADDQHVLRRAVRQQRHVRQHLLVDELVAPR